MTSSGRTEILVSNIGFLIFTVVLVHTTVMCKYCIYFGAKVDNKFTVQHYSSKNSKYKSDSDNVTRLATNKPLIILLNVFGVGTIL